MNTTCFSCLWTGPAFDAHGEALRRCMACGSKELVRDDEEWPEEDDDQATMWPKEVLQ